MFEKIKTVCERLAAVLSAVCIIIGIVMMMCETPDLHAQMVTLFKGFGLFCLGAIPGLILASLRGMDANDERIYYGRN